MNTRTDTLIAREALSAFRSGQRIAPFTRATALRSPEQCGFKHTWMTVLCCVRDSDGQLRDVRECRVCGLQREFPFSLFGCDASER